MRLKPLDLPPHVWIGVSVGRGYGLFARHRINLGDLIFVFAGPLVATPFASPRAMQIAFGHSLESDRGFEDLLNHSCSPNARVVELPVTGGFALVAIDPIPAGREITYDYDTTEADLDAQGCAFDCRCGADGCRGTVRGWDHLTDEGRAAIAWRTMSWLKGERP